MLQFMGLQRVRRDCMTEQWQQEARFPSSSDGKACVINLSVKLPWCTQLPWLVQKADVV